MFQSKGFFLFGSFIINPFKMVIATLKEVKDNENRVGLTPYGVEELVKEGFEVIVQEAAGIGSGFSDGEYVACGAKMLRNPEDIVKEADILVKVKEPLPSEYNLIEQFEEYSLG